MKSLKYVLPISLSVILVFSACHKKETVEVDNETQSVVDNAVAEQEFMGIVPAVNSVAIKSKGTGADPNRSAFAACDTLTYVSGDTTYTNLNSPPIYTMSLNTASCSPFSDAKLREGTLQVKLYGRVKVPGSKIRLIMTNYKAANLDPNKKIAYQCDSILIKTLTNSSAVREFNVKIFNGKCVGANNSWTTKYSTDRTIRHEYAGNVIKIWGTSNGTNREGRNFSVDVSSAAPLTKHENCQFISFGILNLTPEGFKTRRVDYSSGTNTDSCDDDATFSINGNTIAFKLK